MQQLPITQNLSMQEEFLLYDVAAERALLAILIKKPDLIVDAERMIRPESFFNQLHQYIYKIMLWISQQSAKNGWPLAFDGMSMLRVAEYVGPAFKEMFLQRTEGMEQVRNIELIVPMVTPSQFPQYCHTVLDRASRVQAYRKSRAIQEAVLDLHKNPSAKQVAVQAESDFGHLAFSGFGSDGNPIKHITEGDQEYLAKCMMHQEFAHLQLFSVNLPLFPFWMSLMNGGLRRGGLIMTTARPKTGKSTLLLSGAMILTIPDLLPANPLPPVPVLFMDTEMTKEEQYSRGLAHAAGVHEFDILSGKFIRDNTSTQALGGAIHRLRNAPFFYCNVAGRSLDYKQSIMRQFRNNYVGTETVTFQGRTYTFSRSALIIYDWLKLPDLGSLKEAKEYQILGSEASGLKDCAKDLGIPVWAGGQNNREAVGAVGKDYEEMGEAFVGGSDRITQFCDLLTILRNVTAEEAAQILAKFGARPNTKDYQSLRFNQFLHIQVQRQGPDYRRGIPLYLDRGMARYQEISDPDTIRFVQEMRKTKRGTQQGGSLPKSAADAKQQQSGGPANQQEAALTL